MGCPAVTTSCCVLAWPLKLYLSRCHPRRSATVKARGGDGASSEHLVGRPQALHILPIEVRTLTIGRRHRVHHDPLAGLIEPMKVRRRGIERKPALALVKLDCRDLARKARPHGPSDRC